MYKNIFFDYFKGKVHLWELVNNKTVHNTYDIEHYYYVEDESKQSPIKDIYGVPVIRRTATNKKSIKELKESGLKMWESDLPDAYKFLTQKYKGVDIKHDLNDFTIACIDIEVAANEFPDPEDAKYPINLITLQLFNKHKRGQTFTFGLQPYTGTSKAVENYYHCVDEKTLLESFIDVFRRFKIDILTGWNILGFDITYIVNRCTQLQIEKSLSPVDSISKTYDKENNITTYSIAGISVLDYMILYKKFAKEKRESYSLQYISMFEIKEGKLDFEGQINDLYARDWNLFVEYNIQDTTLVKKLDDKLKYIDLALGLVYQALVPIEKVISSVAVITGLVMKYCNNKNLIIPDRTSSHTHESFAGAYCESHAGFYKNLISYDIESLYPHMVMCFNISPETLVMDDKKAESLSWTNDCIKTPFPDIWYDKRKKGIIPEIIEDIFKQRKKHKAFQKEARENKDKDLERFHDMMQYTFKILINSIYGVLGNEFFHFYNVNNAKVVTAGGRELIQWVAKNINDYFLNYAHKNKKFFGVVDEKNKLTDSVVKLIDTDSNYICLDELKKKMAPEKSSLEFLSFVEKEFLNNTFFKQIIDVYCKKYDIPNLINFKREKLISKGFLLAKKKYAVETLDKEGFIYDVPKIDITGIEIVRTSTPSFCRKHIKSVLKKIFETENMDSVIELLKTIKSDFMKCEIEDIAFPRGVSDYDKYSVDISTIPNLKSGTPIHVRAAIQYNYLVKKYNIPSMPISNGTKIKFIYVNDNNELHTNVVGFVGKCPKEIKERFSVDFETQWLKSLLSPVQLFFDTLRWGTIELKKNNLKSFFN